MATQEEIQIANKTARNTPAIGKNAITPRAVRMYIDDNRLEKTATILDFGAGKYAAHAQAMVADGYLCLAHEFGDNIDPKVHCELAMQNHYDVVFASNVLNVQSSFKMLRETIAQVSSVMTTDSIFFANYPLTPRKAPFTVDEMLDILSKTFSIIERVGGTAAAPLWKMRK